MSYQIKWLSDDYSDANIGDIFTVVNGVFLDKAGDERGVKSFQEGVEYEIIVGSSKVKVITLVTYNGKLYDKQAFEEAINGLIVYEVQS